MIPEWSPIDGNTPTCVGKTKLSAVNLKQNKKHPHLRGEDHWSQDYAQYHRETPPPAWGRPSARHSVSPYLGNTPTCVGKTDYAAEARWMLQKHPHLRGEDVG